MTDWLEHFHCMALIVGPPSHDESCLVREKWFRCPILSKAMSPIIPHEGAQHHCSAQVAGPEGVLCSSSSRRLVVLQDEPPILAVNWDTYTALMNSLPITVSKQVSQLSASPGRTTITLQHKCRPAHASPVSRSVASTFSTRFHRSRLFSLLSRRRESVS